MIRRRISLKEHSLILAIFRYRPSAVHAGEKDFKVEGLLLFGFHDGRISAIHPDHERLRHLIYWGAFG
jgi:hypothetical protein